MDDKIIWNTKEGRRLAKALDKIFVNREAKT